MAAGPELSVAATKSFIASLAMLLRITAAWTDNDDLRAALDRLPDRLAQATELDWGGCLDTFANAAAASLPSAAARHFRSPARQP